MACGACVTNRHFQTQKPLKRPLAKIYQSIFMISQTVFPFRRLSGQINKGTAV
nr:MAG TPA: hypothetical protein [Bacteriophage sp.]DAW88685.1 MAG TPA: hypothetical protein [Bacteriophage sp.]DAY16107.1 MAG TPA: hypothetical protein [Caudoviricetes sp.]